MKKCPKLFSIGQKNGLIEFEDMHKYQFIKKKMTISSVKSLKICTKFARKHILGYKENPENTGVIGVCCNLCKMEIISWRTGARDERL